MSKLYSLYKQQKSKNDNKIYLFKSGIFYIAIAEDAYFLSRKFNFKLTKLNDTIEKCGFPVSSLNKYIKIFSNNNIDFEFVDITQNTTYTPNNLTANLEINNLLNKISAINIENLSISEAYKFIEEIHVQAKKIKQNF